MTNIFEQIFGKSLNKSHVGWMVVILQVTGKELQRSAKRSSHDAQCDDDDDDEKGDDGVPPLQCILVHQYTAVVVDLSFTLKSESIADWSDLLSSARGKSGR